MAGVPDQTQVTPENTVDKHATVVGGSEAEAAHRRLEHMADKAANRASERIKRDEAGNGEFSNIGPV